MHRYLWYWDERLKPFVEKETLDEHVESPNFMSFIVLVVDDPENVLYPQNVVQAVRYLRHKRSCKRGFLTHEVATDWWA